MTTTPTPVFPASAKDVLKCVVLVADESAPYESSEELSLGGEDVHAYFFSIPIKDANLVFLVGHGILFDNDWCANGCLSKVRAKDKQGIWTSLDKVCE